MKKSPKIQVSLLMLWKNCRRLCPCSSQPLTNKQTCSIVPLMKTKFVFAVVLVLLLAACGTENYPDIAYYNNSGAEVNFRTKEKDSPTYKITDTGPLRLSSDVRGRSIIDSIKEQYITWEYINSDPHNIEFKKYDIKLLIKNNTSNTVVVKEKSDLLSGLYNSEEPVNIGVDPELWDKIPDTELINEIILDPKSEKYVMLHTKKPVWKITPETTSITLIDKDGNEFMAGADQLDKSKEPYTLTLK